MSCEWEDMTTQNPIITTIIDKIKNSKVTAVGPNARSTVPLPSDTKAGTATESNAIEEESQSLQ
jgi:hypothetical protein